MTTKKSQASSSRKSASKTSGNQVPVAKKTRKMIQADFHLEGLDELTPYQRRVFRNFCWKMVVGLVSPEPKETRFIGGIYIELYDKPIVRKAPSTRKEEGQL